MKETDIPAGVTKAILMNALNGRDSQANQIYLKTYLASISEAYKLLEEAELLFKNEFYPRAYFLGMAALEEISKSQLAADVFTGLIEEVEFKKAFTNHKEKIKRIKWIQIDGNSYPYFNSDLIQIKDFNFQKKLKSMYVDADFKLKKISTPADSITKEDAENIIKAVKVGLHRIYQVTEENGEQIGTKGFMK
jgi:AbiV family abortive infection protein